MTSPAAYARSFDGRVAELVGVAARRVPAFAERLRAAGVEASDVVDVASLQRLPPLSKDELGELQAKAPPFGGLLARDAEVRRVFQSPGPLYEPEEPIEDPWRFGPALQAAGFTSDDVVLNAFSYHLSPAGAMMEEGARALGCTVVPAGIGNIELQARACRDLGVTAYIGLPSYLNALLDKAEEAGLTPGSWPLNKAFVTAEPLPRSLRARLEERVTTVRQGYGTAEAGNLGYECERMEGLHVPADALVEVCDLSSGEALWDGREGQVVATLLRTAYPIVRLGTGDLSRFLPEDCSCGIPTPRIAGWLGRVGDAVKVRGMFLHPRQLTSVMSQLGGVDRYRFVIERHEHKDVLRCEVVPSEQADADALAQEIRERIRSGLRFSVDVAVVEDVAPDEGPIVDRRTWD